MESCSGEASAAEIGGLRKTGGVRACVTPRRRSDGVVPSRDLNTLLKCDRSLKRQVHAMSEILRRTCAGSRNMPTQRCSRSSSSNSPKVIIQWFVEYDDPTAF